MCLSMSVAYLQDLLRHSRAPLDVILPVNEDLRLDYGDQVICLHTGLPIWQSL